MAAHRRHDKGDPAQAFYVIDGCTDDLIDVSDPAAACRDRNRLTGLHLFRQVD